VEQGLVKMLIPTHERDTEKGKERAMGVLLSRHREETFEAKTETKRLLVHLERGQSSCAIRFQRGRGRITPGN
jgi:hypothetical protein